MTRDSIAYAITVLLLILTLRDGRVEWHEGLILILTYLFYILSKFYAFYPSPVARFSLPRYFMPPSDIYRNNYICTIAFYPFLFT